MRSFARYVRVGASLGQEQLIRKIVFDRRLLRPAIISQYSAFQARHLLEKSEVLEFSYHLRHPFVGVVEGLAYFSKLGSAIVH